jgi:hypothetical protein
MFHSTSHQMMRELDTGSAYRVQFKTSANHHTLSDMDELVQNHEQEQKAHDAVVQQAASRQKQLNTQLQMHYDTLQPLTRSRNRVKSSDIEALEKNHTMEQETHNLKVQEAEAHQEKLNAYGDKLATVLEHNEKHKIAQQQHEEALKAAESLKTQTDAASAELRKHVKELKSIKPPSYFGSNVDNTTTNRVQSSRRSTNTGAGPPKVLFENGERVPQNMRPQTGADGYPLHYV